MSVTVSTQVARLLQEQGYTNNRGKPITRQDISHFMSWRGFRLRKTHNKRQAQAPVPTPKRKYTRRAQAADLTAKSLASAERTYLQDVEDIVTSNLADHLKERMIRALHAG